MHDTGQRSRGLEETGAPRFRGPQPSAMRKRTNERTNEWDGQLYFSSFAKVYLEVKTMYRKNVGQSGKHFLRTFEGHAFLKLSPVPTETSQLGYSMRLCYGILLAFNKAWISIGLAISFD